MQPWPSEPDNTVAFMLTRRNVLTSLLATGLTPAHAQIGSPPWPERTVTLVHGQPPAGDTDVITRALAESLRRRLGHSFVVDARTGSGGRIAAGQVARAAPDGHTLMIMPAGYAVTAALYRTLPYRPVDDFAMISMLTESPLLMVTSAENEVRTLADLVAQARGRATRLLYGSAGNGSLQHLAGELLSRTLNISFRHVPYRGTVQAINDIIARRIDFMIDLPALQLPLIRSGRMRALMVTSPRRYFALPQVPSAVEVDLPAFSFSAWQGLAGPAGIAPATVDRITTEIAAVLAEPEMIERLRAIGYDPATTPPNEFRARVISDIERWIDVVETSGLERI